MKTLSFCFVILGLALALFSMTLFVNEVVHIPVHVHTGDYRPS